jgi:hypothetical protein
MEINNVSKNPCLTQEQVDELKQRNEERVARENAAKRERRMAIEDHIERRQNREKLD